MTACLSAKCTAPTNFSVAPQTRHSRFELPSASAIFSALNISIGHPPGRASMTGNALPVKDKIAHWILSFREKVAVVKLGHGKEHIANGEQTWYKVPISRRFP